MSRLLTRQDAESFAIEVVTEIAEREGVDPLDLYPPLHDVVDPDALEAVCRDSIEGHAREGVSVEFTYHGYRVAIESGDVRIEDAAAAHEHRLGE